MKGIITSALLVALAAAVPECPSDGSQRLVAHSNCNKFYSCSNGVPVEMTCADGLFFNLNTGECDWQANVDCGDRNNPGSSSTTTAPCSGTPTTLPPTTPPPTTPPPTTPPPTTLPPTTPCSTTPTPTTTVPPCTNTPTTSAPCPNTPTTVAPSTPTTVAPSTPNSGFLENGCPVNPHIHWLLPVEGDCTSFYYCVWGELEMRSCPDSLHFNRVIQVCDWPANAGCAA